MKKIERVINPKVSIYLFSKEAPKGEIFKFAGGKDSEEYKGMIESGWFDTPAQLDLPKEELQLTTEQVQAMRPEDLKAMLESYGFIVLTPEQLKAEVNKLISVHIDIKEFTDSALIEEAERRGLKDSDGQSDDAVELDTDQVINTTKIDDDEDLLAKFKADAKSLTREEHIILGKELGVKLRINFGEQTMIDKINEALEAK